MAFGYGDDAVGGFLALSSGQLQQVAGEPPSSIRDFSKEANSSELALFTEVFERNGWVKNSKLAQTTHDKNLTSKTDERLGLDLATAEH